MSARACDVRQDNASVWLEVVQMWWSEPMRLGGGAGGLNGSETCRWSWKTDHQADYYMIILHYSLYSRRK